LTDIFGIFPLPVVLGGVVRAFGPAAFFPVTGALLATAILAGLTQPAWRAFGRSEAQPAAA
jgi:hypothetical protein